MKKVLVCLTMIVAVTLMVASVQAVPVWLNAAFCQTCAGKVAPGYNDSLDRYSPLAVDTHGRLILSGELDLSGASFTPDTASVAGSNYALRRIARTDSLNLPYLPGIYARETTTDSLALLTLPYLSGSYIRQSSADSLIRLYQPAIYTRTTSLDSLSRVHLPYLPGSYARQSSADSLLRIMEPILTLINRLTFTNDSLTAFLHAYTRNIDSTVTATNVRLDAMALWDSTGNNTYSKQFNAGVDTMLFPGPAKTIKLVATNPYIADYRMKEISFMVLGDTVDVDYYGPSSTVTSGPHYYPGESFTWPVACDSVVVTHVPGVVGAVAEVRWWVRGR